MMAAFFDGRFARRHSVDLQVNGGLLVISGETLAKPIEWPVAEIGMMSREGDDGPWTFSCSAMGRARLRLDDRILFSKIVRTRPDLVQFKPRYQGLKRGLIAGGLSGFCVAMLVLLVPYLAAPAKWIVPAAFEHEFGSLVRNEVTLILGAGEPQFCDDPAGTRVLDGLVGRLQQPLASRYEHRIEVIDVPMVNAFAAPGGWLILTGGLLAEAEDSDELAAMIAHEMAHVELQHGLESLIASQGRSMLLSMIGTGLTASVFEGAALSLLNAGHSRAQERAADDMAIAVLNDQAIDTRGMARFFDRLAAQSVEGALSYWSTHPASSGRASKARENVSENQNPDEATAEPAAFKPALNQQDWQAVKVICASKTEPAGG